MTLGSIRKRKAKEAQVAYSGSWDDAKKACRRFDFGAWIKHARLVGSCQATLIIRLRLCLSASNMADAGGLDFARGNRISTSVINHREFASRESFDAALNAELQKHNLDLICCAGFMRIMTPVLI